MLQLETENLWSDTHFHVEFETTSKIGKYCFLDSKIEVRFQSSFVEPLVNIFFGRFYYVNVCGIRVLLSNQTPFVVSNHPNNVDSGIFEINFFMFNKKFGKNQRLFSNQNR